MSTLVILVEMEGDHIKHKSAATDLPSLSAELCARLGATYELKIEYIDEEMEHFVLLDDWPDFLEQKKKHVRVTRVARAPGGPAPSSSSPKKSALVDKHKNERAHKKFGCFLSHHKTACAMEARFLKGELGRLLEAEAFLDSDDLFGECFVVRGFSQTPVSFCNCVTFSPPLQTSPSLPTTCATAACWPSCSRPTYLRDRGACWKCTLLSRQVCRSSRSPFRAKATTSPAPPT
jgi:hypothetical protein